MGHVSSELEDLTEDVFFDAIADKKAATWIGKGSSSEGKYKVAHSIGKPYLDVKSERVRKSSPEQVVHLKSSESEQNSLYGNKTCSDDELVKHMTNLPEFLQRVEKDSSIQEKALNFGVLDWKRLEKWRYNERMPAKNPKKASSRTSNSVRPIGVQPKMVPNLRKHPSSHALNSGKEPMTPDVSRNFSPQRQPAPSQNYLYSSKEEKTVDHEDIKFKGKKTCNKEVLAAQSRRTDKQLRSVYRRVEFYNRIDPKTIAEKDVKKDQREELIIEKEASPSAREENELIFLPADDRINYLGKTGTARFTEEVNSTSACCTTDSQVPVLKNFSRKSCSVSSQLTEARNSVAGHEETTGNGFSDCFSPMELYSGEFTTDIPHSCPFPFSEIIEAESSLGSLDAHFNRVQPKGKQGALNGMHAQISPSREISDVDVLDSLKGRPPSPTRRFSFSFGRMNRSFSFKESSTVSQLSTEHPTGKSGPVSIDSSEGDKGSISSRGKSSPLRRLLDPLLKYKGQLADTTRSPNRRLPFILSKSLSPMGPQDRKPEASTFQALLQVTLKNGLPFFRLVVDRSSDMLAAAVKRRPNSGNNDSYLSYAFYSVHEVKKKSMNWISQGSKGKSGSLGYNMVGQMKLSNSSACDLRECVLYGVDMGQVEKQTPELVANKEIAAIVVKNSSKKVDDGVTNDKDELCIENDSSCVDEKELRNSGMVVVLPSGVHGIPINGAPSSLLDRWRSGGLCDCGGWDVGCKLRILCDDNKKRNISAASVTCDSADGVTLLLQGREGKSKPAFRLVALKDELYSIELDSSVSLLEAFAICVAYVTCRNVPETTDGNNQSCTNHQEAVLGDNAMRKSTRFEDQLPEKFVTCPPLSPAGRI